MKKILIAGIPANDFGVNNYSYGMSPITFSPKDIKVEDVHKLEGCFLHPTERPNSEEIFALLGTEEQYINFCAETKENYCVGKAALQYSIMGQYEEFCKLRDQYLKEYKRWFD